MPTTSFVIVHEHTQQSFVFGIPTGTLIGAVLAVAITSTVLFIWLRRRARS